MTRGQHGHGIGTETQEMAQAVDESRQTRPAIYEQPHNCFLELNHVHTPATWMWQ